MNNKISTLESNHTWVLTTLPPNKHPIGSKWVFRIKYNANGSVDKYKARLVGKGYTQQEGIDYTKTFAPVAKMVTVRRILVISSINNWSVQQLDINNTFLHDDILLTSNNSVLISEIKDQLHHTFSIKDLSALHFYLGIEFLRNSNGIVMTQRKYALYLIKYANLQNEKPSKTPLDPRVKLTYTDREPLQDPSHYRTLVGKLIYLTINRPHLVFATRLLN
ncbi:retrovirus-related pol polyprotein from transposon TNT 1-94 [Tanacetum coccineum]